MALLVDGELSTIADLEAQDSGVVQVAHTEGIDLGRKLDLAQREMEIELEALLRRADTGRLDEVVATKAMSRWHALLTLAMVYRDAYFSQLNDRFGGRWRAYQEEANEAGHRVLEGGVGLISTPMRKPLGMEAALGMGPIPPRAYYVRVTWVDSQGQESAPSPLDVVEARTHHSLTVKPTGQRAGVAGWHLYAGYSPDTLARQTESPLGVDEEWHAPDGPLQDGAAPGTGQAPERYVTQRRLLRRW
jgi:hypothetical protein